MTGYRIEKFVLDKIRVEPVRVDLPSDARFACGAVQAGKICVWIHMGTVEATSARTFVVYATSEDISYRASYLATLHDSGFVYHLFEQNGLL